MISVNEYNGYLNAIRIVRDRAIQQIDRNRADKHGYTLVKAEKRAYKDEKIRYDRNAWVITKSTPYSLKIGLQEVSYMIERDLSEFYNYKTLPVVRSNNAGYKEHLSINGLLDYYERYYLKKMDRNSIYDEAERKALSWMDELNGIVVFNITRIGRNYGTGCFEVTYWATDLI